MSSFEHDVAHCYSTYKSCVIQIWRGEILPIHISLMRNRWRKVVESLGEFAILVVVLPNATPPSIALRAEIKQLYVELDTSLRGVATVLEDQGIKGSTASIVMSTMMLLAQPSYPTKNCTSVTSAAEWMASTVARLDSSGLVAAVEEARSEYRSICAKRYGEALVRQHSRTKAS